MAGVSLPLLEQHPSPNHSTRRGVVPWLVVLHRPVGSFESALRTLTDPSPPGGDDARVSAHILTDSNRRAAQLVPWDQKAWASASFNAASYNVEVDDDAWRIVGPSLTVADEPALASAARIVAFLCTRTGIPPLWTHEPLRLPGVCRHYDLRRAGGGHTDPTTHDALWRRFVAMVIEEHNRGGFRPVYGVGELHRIDT